MKISIIGAGNVGAMAAYFLKNSYRSDDKIVLLDIKLGLAEGKALDIAQVNSNYKIIGVTDDYESTKNSDYIIITSGTPRRPGMTREDLISINEGIVKDVLDKSFEYSPTAKFIIVSNPVDTMTYLAVKHLGAKGVSSDNIFGFGNDLDTLRLIYYLKLKNIRYNDAYVIGGHGDKTMIPIVESKAPFDVDKVRVAKEQTKSGGSAITSLLGTSASIAPGYAISSFVDFLSGGMYNQNKCCSVYDPNLDVCYGTRLVNINDHICKVVCPIEYQKDLEESIAKIKEVNSLLHV